MKINIKSTSKQISTISLISLGILLQGGLAQADKLVGHCPSVEDIAKTETTISAGSLTFNLSPKPHDAPLHEGYVSGSLELKGGHIDSYRDKNDNKDSTVACIYKYEYIEQKEKKKGEIYFHSINPKMLLTFNISVAENCSPSKHNPQCNIYEKE